MNDPRSRRERLGEHALAAARACAAAAPPWTQETSRAVEALIRSCTPPAPERPEQVRTAS